jgi:hypothetical protein
MKKSISIDNKKQSNQVMMSGLMYFKTAFRKISDGTCPHKAIASIAIMKIRSYHERIAEPVR